MTIIKSEGGNGKESTLKSGKQDIKAKLTEAHVSERRRDWISSRRESKVKGHRQPSRLGSRSRSSELVRVFKGAQTTRNIGEQKFEIPEYNYQQAPSKTVEEILAS